MYFFVSYNDRQKIYLLVHFGIVLNIRRRDPNVNAPITAPPNSVATKAAGSVIGFESCLYIALFRTSVRSTNPVLVLSLSFFHHFLERELADLLLERDTPSNFFAKNNSWFESMVLITVLRISLHPRALNSGLEDTSSNAGPKEHIGSHLYPSLMSLSSANSFPIMVEVLG